MVIAVQKSREWKRDFVPDFVRQGCDPRSTGRFFPAGSVSLTKKPNAWNMPSPAMSEASNMLSPAKSEASNMLSPANSDAAYVPSPKKTDDLSARPPHWQILEHTGSRTRLFTPNCNGSVPFEQVASAALKKVVYCVPGLLECIPQIQREIFALITYHTNEMHRIIEQLSPQSNDAQLKIFKERDLEKLIDWIVNELVVMHRECRQCSELPGHAFRISTRVYNEPVYTQEMLEDGLDYGQVLNHYRFVTTNRGSLGGAGKLNTWKMFSELKVRDDELKIRDYDLKVYRHLCRMLQTCDNELMRHMLRVIITSMSCAFAVAQFVDSVIKTTNEMRVVP